LAVPLPISELQWMYWIWEGKSFSLCGTFV